MKKFRPLTWINKLIRAYHPPTYVVNTLRTEDSIDGRLVSCVDKSSYIAEQYKVLRTNLYSLSPDKPYKTILITSSQPTEGKTVTSCNLAYTLSLDKEKKILLVDADMRKPHVHNIFGIDRKPGFGDILHDRVDIEDFLKKPCLGDLYIIPAGEAMNSSSEILSSAKIKTVLDALKARFDYIIFDSPPVLNVTDASILGSLCDAVIFAIKAGMTQKSAIEEAFHMLSEAQAKPKACVLTNVKFTLDTYYAYKYKYYKYADKHK